MPAPSGPFLRMGEREAKPRELGQGPDMLDGVSVLQLASA